MSLAPYPVSLNPQTIAFCATLLWIVHPLHTQSVTYIVQRMNSMAAMFYILSFLCYVKGRMYLRNKRRILQNDEKRVIASEARQSQASYGSSVMRLLRAFALAMTPVIPWLFFSLSIISGILALGSKEIAVTLPIFIVLYEWYFFQDLSTTWLKHRILPLSGIIVFLIVVAFLYLGVNPIDKILSGYDGRDFTLLERVMTEFRVVILYTTLLFFPHPTRLNLDYDFPLSQSLIEPVSTLLSLIAIIMLIVVALYLAKRERLISFCTLWFFGNFLLESSVIGLELVYEHRTYLPSMMASLLIVTLVHRYITMKWVKTALFCSAVIVLSLWTYERNTVWTDELTLWRDATKKSPEKARPHYNLGLILFDRGMTEEAIQNYTEALRINPDYDKAHNNLGIALTKQGKIDEAIQHFREAISIHPGHAKAYNNMGIAHAKKGEITTAMKCYAEALRLDPEYTDAHINWGSAFVSLGNIDEAIDHYSKAIEKDSGCSEAYVNRGIALHRAGRNEEALDDLLKAKDINPHDSKAYNNLGVILSSMQKYDEAITHYLQSLRINPINAESHYNLGIALTKKGMVRKAIQHYLAALKIRPDYADAHNNLGVLLIREGKIEEAIDHFYEALHADPVHLNACKNIESALAEQMATEEAAAQIEAATKHTENDTSLYNTLGNLYETKGDLDSAIEQYQKVPAVHKEFAQALNNLAIAYTKKGEYKKALSFLYRIIDLKPNGYVPYYNIACIYAKQNKTEESIDWLYKAVEKGFDQWEFLKADPDLDNIRGSSRYDMLINDR
ncbi:MAG: tetratricopeptide repeat protein [Deltaproteobacteria bacterium]|nr:tetratricopeptide repeat protein [Deltaproteobacteria bacterium]